MKKIVFSILFLIAATLLIAQDNSQMMLIASQQQYNNESPSVPVCSYPELVTNGTFDSDVSGWTSINNAALTWNSGQLNIENISSGFGKAYQIITTEIGVEYQINFDFIRGFQNGAYRVGTSVNGTQLISSTALTSTQSVTNTFTATTTTSYITFETNVSGNGGGQNTNYDNVSVKQYDELCDGLLAWYKFEGNINDETSNALNGTNSGGTFASGQLGNAVSFTGGTQSAELPSSALWDMTDFTLSFWIKYESNATGWKCVFEHGRNISNWWAVYQNTDGNRIHFRWTWTGGTVTLDSTSNLTGGTWYYITCVYDSVNADSIIYINGVQDAFFGTPAPRSSNTSNDVIFGENQIGGENWSGSLDELRIYNKVLTPTQILNLYNTY